MSDHIEIDGKKYYEESYLVLANANTERRGELVAALSAENAELAKVLSYLDSITGDDFCADLDIRAAFKPEELSKFEKSAHLKLSIVYRAAHGFDKTNTCYRVHDDWRRQTLEAADALRAEHGQ